MLGSRLTCEGREGGGRVMRMEGSEEEDVGRTKEG
jgi:hypothetical protein